MAEGPPRLAIEGGRPVRDQFLPFARPRFGEEERRAVLAVLDSGWLTVGPRVAELEAALAAYHQVPYAVCVDSCTAALHLALVALELKPGDEVITSPLTFCSTVNVILHAGGTPVLADVEAESLTLDPAQVEAVMGPRTRVLLPVHFGGRPCRMDTLSELARTRGVKVVEDAAHAVGASYRGRKAGTLGDAGCLSFYATKNMTTGEGGALLCDDPRLAERARLLSLHGMDRDAWKRYTEQGSWYYEVRAAGFKYNMTDLEAALGVVQLGLLDALNARRAEIARDYDTAFREHSALRVPAPMPEAEIAHHLYPLQLRLSALTVDRARFLEALRGENIGTSVHFIPIHFHPFYRERLGLVPGAYPQTEAAYAGMVSLPIYPAMTDGDVADVITAVRKVADRYRR